MSYFLSSTNIISSPLLAGLIEDFNFQIRVNVLIGGKGGAKDAAWTDDLSSLPSVGEDGDLAVQELSTDTNVAGLYMGHDANWYLAIPYNDICLYVVNGGSVSVYFNVTEDQAIPNNGVVYKNGIEKNAPATHDSNRFIRCVGYPRYQWGQVACCIANHAWWHPGWGWHWRGP